MNIISAVKDLFTGDGGVAGKVVDAFKAYFPPAMTEQEKIQAEFGAKQLAANIELQVSSVAEKAQQVFNDRIRDMEGTAKDLKTIPIIGHIIIFLRGCQRPLWGFATMYFDNKWLFGSSEFSDKQEIALIVINILVLGFLFGERAVKNLQPMIEKLLKK